MFGLGGDPVRDPDRAAAVRRRPTAEALLRQAAVGDLAATLRPAGRCGADAELVALCTGCLAPRRQDRPTDAGAVAAQVTAYLAAVQERLRRAELEQAAAEAAGGGRAAGAAADGRPGGGAAAARGRRRRGRWWAQHSGRSARRRKRNGARRPMGRSARAMGEARLLLAQAQAEPLGDAGKYREALAAAKKAAELAGAGAASEEMREAGGGSWCSPWRRTPAAAERDRRLLAALLEVRGPREGPNYRRDDEGSLMRSWPSPARRSNSGGVPGLGPDLRRGSADHRRGGHRLKGRPAAVLTEVIAALDEWASERRRTQRSAGSSRVAAA